MIIENYPQLFLDDFYKEADRDWSSFIFLVGHVASIQWGDEFDEYEDLGKNDEQLLQDAFSLIDYLVSSGDFEIGRLVPSKKGAIKNVFYYGDSALILYPNIEALKTDVMALYQDHGFDAEPFHSQIWLWKGFRQKSPFNPRKNKKAV